MSFIDSRFVFETGFLLLVLGLVAQGIYWMRQKAYEAKWVFEPAKELRAIDEYAVESEINIWAAALKS